MVVLMKDDPLNILIPWRACHVEYGGVDGGKSSQHPHCPWHIHQVEYGDVDEGRSSQHPHSLAHHQEYMVVLVKDNLIHFFSVLCTLVIAYNNLIYYLLMIRKKQ